MFWDHPDLEVTLGWMRDAGLDVLDHEHVPEGDVGHTIVRAQLP
jgi:hypothetical protein